MKRKATKQQPSHNKKFKNHHSEETPQLSDLLLITISPSNAKETSCLEYQKVNYLSELLILKIRKSLSFDTVETQVYQCLRFLEVDGYIAFLTDAFKYKHACLQIDSTRDLNVLIDIFIKLYNRKTYDGYHIEEDTVTGSLNLWESRKFVMNMIQHVGAYLIRQASAEIRNDRNMVMKAIKNATDDNFRNVFSSTIFKNDREFLLNVIEYLKLNDKCDERFDEILWGSERAANNLYIRDVMDKIKLQHYHNNGIIRLDLDVSEVEVNVIEELERISERIERKLNLQYESNELRNNYTTVMNYVKYYGLSLEYASDELKNNQEIAIEAIKENPNAFQFISNQLKYDKKFLFKCIPYLSEDLRGNYELMMYAVQRNGLLLEHATFSLKNNPEIVINALKSNVESFQFANAYLKSDFKFMMRAININTNALKEASYVLKENQTILDRIEELNIWINKSKNNLKTIQEYNTPKALSTLHIFPLETNFTTEPFSNSIESPASVFSHYNKKLKNHHSTYDLRLLIELIVRNHKNLNLVIEIIRVLIFENRFIRRHDFTDLLKIIEGRISCSNSITANLSFLKLYCNLTERMGEVYDVKKYISKFTTYSKLLDLICRSISPIQNPTRHSQEELEELGLAAFYLSYNLLSFAPINAHSYDFNLFSLILQCIKKKQSERSIVIILQVIQRFGELFCNSSKRIKEIANKYFSNANQFINYATKSFEESTDRMDLKILIAHVVGVLF